MSEDTQQLSSQRPWSMRTRPSYWLGQNTNKCKFKCLRLRNWWEVQTISALLLPMAPPTRTFLELRWQYNHFDQKDTGFTLTLGPAAWSELDCHQCQQQNQSASSRLHHPSLTVPTNYKRSCKRTTCTHHWTRFPVIPATRPGV